MKVVLVGEESAGTRALETVLDSSAELIAVMTTAPSGRGSAPLWKAATARGLAIWPARRVREASLALELARHEVDLLLNVHSLHVIRGEVLEACRIGAFNLHPGPLPRYAGLNGVSWAIHRGEPEHGVTLHWMEAGIDSGPMVFQETFEITSTDSPVTLMSRCVKLGTAMLSRLLQIAAESPESIPRVAQDLARREYFGRDVPHNGKVRWDLSAVELARFVRACDYGPFDSPWGHPIARHRGRQLQIRRATALESDALPPPGTVLAKSPQGALVACGGGTLRIERMRLEDERASPEILEPGEILENG